MALRVRDWQAPTDRPEVIAERFAAQGARVIHLIDFEGARTGAPVNLDAIGRVAGRVAVPIQVAGGLEGADQIRLAFAAEKYMRGNADSRVPSSE